MARKATRKPQSRVLPPPFRLRWTGRSKDIPPPSVSTTPVPGECSPDIQASVIASLPLRRRERALHSLDRRPCRNQCALRRGGVGTGPELKRDGEGHWPFRRQIVRPLPQR